MTPHLGYGISKGAALKKSTADQQLKLHAEISLKESSKCDIVAAQKGALVSLYGGLQIEDLDLLRYRKFTNRHFSVTPYITICPSTETYFRVYLRGAMSAVTGIYLFRLLLNIICFVLRSFCTLTNSAYHDEIPHDGISPVYKCKKHVPKKYISQLKCSRIFF